jgi:hypothetical protein
MQLFLFYTVKSVFFAVNASLCWLKNVTGLNVKLLACCIFISVADPGCLSQIPDPDFYPSRISNPKILNPKKNYSRSRIFVQGVKMAPDLGSRSATLIFIILNWRNICIKLRKTGVVSAYSNNNPME